ncbi:nucleotidyl transferase AbiEii/AbiGii toxin family protein [Corynebacteriaceae bacterium 6-324]
MPFAAKTFSILSYQVENQLADRVCAMFEMHGSRVSTRYRDLYDTGLIALELDVDHEALRNALRRQEEIRRISLPSRMVFPSLDWPSAYEKFVGTLHKPVPHIESADKALFVAGELLDPVLRSINQPDAYCDRVLRRP